MLKIDILLLIGGKGGFENALKYTGDYLADHKCEVRFIQLVKTDVIWYSEKTSLVYLDTGRHFNWDDCLKKYQSLLLNSVFPDIIIVAGSPDLIYPAKGATQALGLSIPVIFWPHSEIESYNTGSTFTLKLIDYAEFAFAISDSIAQYISDNYPNKIVYRVNNTFDPSKLKYSENRNSNKIAFIGRLSKEKNISLIIEALSKTKSPWELEIIGSGDELSTLKRLSCELKCDEQVHFRGWQDEPWSVVSDCRALVLSSVESIEGAPLTCIEALASGMPVISTPLSFVQDIIIQGITGYIYDYNDSSALAEVLNTLSLTQHTADISKKCHESVLDYYPQIALYDFFKKVEASSKLIGLPQRNWKDKSTRIIRPAQ